MPERRILGHEDHEDHKGKPRSCLSVSYVVIFVIFVAQKLRFSVAQRIPDTSQISAYAIAPMRADAGTENSWPRRSRRSQREATELPLRFLPGDLRDLRGPKPPCLSVAQRIPDTSQISAYAIAP